jgi:hypothetical protein
LQHRDFLAIGQQNLELATWAAAPYGWTARPARHAEFAPIGGMRGVELSHPRAPVTVLLVEPYPDRRDYENLGTSRGFVCLSSGLDGAFQLPSLLEHPAIRQLVCALGSVAHRRRLEPALTA